jgi:hypothetical protein
LASEDTPPGATGAWEEVARISDFVSFEPDKVDVFIDGKQLGLEPAEPVTLYGSDRGLDLEELVDRSAKAGAAR